MSDFKTRLNEEYAQLGDKLGKLTVFLQGEHLAGLPANQQDLLKKQAVHMQDYYNVLKERIDLLDKDASVSSTFGNDTPATPANKSADAVGNTPYGPEGKPAGQSGESEAGSNQAQS